MFFCNGSAYQSVFNVTAHLHRMHTSPSCYMKVNITVKNRESQRCDSVSLSHLKFVGRGRIYQFASHAHPVRW